MTILLSVSISAALMCLYCLKQTINISHSYNESVKIRNKQMEDVHKVLSNQIKINDSLKEGIKNSIGLLKHYKEETDKNTLILTYLDKRLEKLEEQKPC